MTKPLLEVRYIGMTAIADGVISSFGDSGLIWRPMWVIFFFFSLPEPGIQMKGEEMMKLC